MTAGEKLFNVLNKHPDNLWESQSNEFKEYLQRHAIAGIRGQGEDEQIHIYEDDHA